MLKPIIPSSIITRFIANTKVGDTVNYNGEVWTVTHVYSHNVSIVNFAGKKNSMCLGDLVIAGKEAVMPNEKNSKTFTL